MEQKIRLESEINELKTQALHYKSDIKELHKVIENLCILINYYMNENKRLKYELHLLNTVNKT